MGKSLFRGIVDNIPLDVRFFTRYAGDLAMSVGELLVAKGITQRNLAGQLGMKESQLSRILSGSGNPTLKTIARLSAALDEDLLRFPAFEKWERENPVYHEKPVLKVKRVPYTSYASRIGEAASQYYAGVKRSVPLEAGSTHVYPNAA